MDESKSRQRRDWRDKMYINTRIDEIFHAEASQLLQVRAMIENGWALLAYLDYLQGERMITSSMNLMEIMDAIEPLQEEHADAVTAYEALQNKLYWENERDEEVDDHLDHKAEANDELDEEDELAEVKGKITRWLIRCEEDLENWGFKEVEFDDEHLNMLTPSVGDEEKE